MHASSGLTQGSDPHLLCLPHWQTDSLPLDHQGSPSIYTVYQYTSILYIYSICIEYQSYLTHIHTHTILILSIIYINIFSVLIIYFFFYCVFSHSVMSNSLQPCELQSIRPLLSMEFSRQEYWSRLPFPTPGSLPHPGSNPPLWHLLHCQVDSITEKEL